MDIKSLQDVRQTIDISESTLYPVLRRLRREDCLEVCDDMAIDGWEPQILQADGKGRVQLNLYRGNG